MDKEQLLLEIAKLMMMNQQAFEVIKGYQAEIQKNLKEIDKLKVQIAEL